MTRIALVYGPRSGTGSPLRCYIDVVKNGTEHINISPYRLELLQPIPAFHRRARIGKNLDEGQLVYYGPSPVYYGIGEVKQVVGHYVAVDFRGTGQFGVHEDVLENQYLIPIPQATMSLL